MALQQVSVKTSVCIYKYSNFSASSGNSIVIYRVRVRHDPRNSSQKVFLTATFFVWAWKKD